MNSDLKQNYLYILMNKKCLKEAFIITLTMGLSICFPLLQRRLHLFILCFGGHNKALSLFQMSWFVQSAIQIFLHTFSEQPHMKVEGQECFTLSDSLSSKAFGLLHLVVHKQLIVWRIKKESLGEKFKPSLLSHFCTLNHCVKCWWLSV